MAESGTSLNVEWGFFLLRERYIDIKRIMTK